MAKDLSKVIIKVEDEQGWTSIMEASDKRLVILDAHADWCGPCDAMLPTFSRVFLDYDGAEERIALVSASVAKVGSFIQPTLPNDAHVTLDKQGCQPVFVLYRFKSVIAVVQGVDAPALLQHISVNIPDKPSKENQD